MKTVCDWEAEGGDCGGDVTSWVSACPGGFWKVFRKRTSERGTGDQTPKMGSLCRVRVREKAEESAEALGRSLPCAGKDGEPTNAHGHASTQATLLLRSTTTVLQVPLDTWVLLRLGEGQCDVIEGCLEGMKEEEMCELLVCALNADSRPRPGPGQLSSMSAPDSKGEGEGNAEQHPGTGQLPADPLHFMVELQSFTPGRESWEMSTSEKWEWVKKQRERGGQRFREGDLWGAADCYSRALKLLITLKGEKGGGETDRKEGGGEMEGEEKKNVPEGGVEGGSGGDGENIEGQRGGVGGEGAQKDPAMAIKKYAQEKIPLDDEYNVVRAGLHSNMALCQLKLGQPAKAQRSSARATELDPASTKAWYRLGQACCQIGELGMARTALRKVLELQPGSPSALKALREVGVQEKEQDTKLGHRLSKMFN
ncbi:FK506-binding protein-like [Anguilla rostrata]|uniref:FK506-binding protein-like n=1 Tax=Anguilla rostrata TaxID=7938 RepID=UPI0030D4A39B